MKHLDARHFAAEPYTHSTPLPSLSPFWLACYRKVAVSSERRRPAMLIGTRHIASPQTLRAGTDQHDDMEGTIMQDK